MYHSSCPCISLTLTALSYRWTHEFLDTTHLPKQFAVKGPGVCLKQTNKQTKLPSPFFEIGEEILPDVRLT